MANSINITFPFLDDKEKNYFLKTNKITKDAIKSDLLLLVLTEKGERYYEPDYGTNLKQFLFQPSDSLTEEDVKQEIKLTVTKYLPKITIKDISFIPNENRENSVIFTIQFNYTDQYFNTEDFVSVTF